MLYNWSMKITKFWVLIRKVTWKILALCIEIRHLEVEAFEASEASEALSDRHPSDFAYVALIPWSIAQNLTASARYEVTIGTTKKKSDMTGWCEKKNSRRLKALEHNRQAYGGFQSMGWNPQIIHFHSMK
jgi:glycogen synthase